MHGWSKKSLRNTETFQKQGRYRAEVAFALFIQLLRVQFSMFPNFLNNDVDVAEFYQWRWLEESGQRLENID